MLKLPPEIATPGRVVPAQDDIAMFRSLTVDEKLRTLKQDFTDADLSALRYTDALSRTLLPKLLLLREETSQQGRRVADPSMPTWEEACRRLGTTAAKINRWQRKTQAGQDIAALLGREPKRRKPPQRDENTERQLRLAADRVIRAQWVERNHKKADRLAEEYMEANEDF